MLKHYLRIALRNIAKYKGYSLINISGLVIGFACSIVILCYISHEMSYDRFHKNADNIYRVVTKVTMENKINDWALIMGPVGPVLKNDFPEVVKVVRLNKFLNPALINYEEGEQSYIENNVMFAEEDFFNLFSFELTRGNPDSVLKAPGSAVLTEKIARKYFGDEDPIGKKIKCQEVEYEVTGIAEDAPENSHFKFEILLSFSTLVEKYVQQWRIVRFHTYIQLRDGISPKELEEKFPPFMDKYIGDDLPEMGIKKWELFLQPITDIHLYSHLRLELEPNGDIKNIFIFLTIALFVLVIACINFMILTTARSAKRAIEVGVKKTFGAERSKLVQQFIGESILMSMISLLLSFIVSKFFFIFFNEITGRQIGFNIQENWYFIFVFLGLALLIGLIGGSYPAFYLSSFEPIKVFKGDLKSGTRNVLLRNILVILQFFISIASICSLFIVYQQLDFIKNRDLGFKKENLMVVTLRKTPRLEEDRMRFETLKTEMLKIPGVKSFSAAMTYPGSPIDESVVFPEGWNGSFSMANLPVDYDFVETMGMELIAGRVFSKDYLSDVDAVIINETAVKSLGWEDPIGKKIKHIYGRGERILTQTVIGVIKDFHLASLHTEIAPLKLSLNWRVRRVFLRLDPENIPGSKDSVAETWDSIFPGVPIDYFFFENSLDNLYIIEQRIGKAFINFTFLSIFIACLGLFGLASFNTEQRKKEIGVRKAFGASVLNIAWLVIKKIIKLVIIAAAIACPIAYFVMDRWLENYAYRIDINLLTFILSTLMALIIALIAVSYQTLKAANLDPVKTLKYE